MNLSKKYHELMCLFDEIRQEVKRRNPHEYERWKAYGFELDGTFVSMGPNLEEIVGQLEEEEEDEDYDDGFDADRNRLVGRLDAQVLAAYNQAIEDNDEDVCQFILDMDTSEHTICYYRGRNFYYGPAVSCDSVSDVMSCTKVSCIFDELGKGYIVYPRSGLSKPIGEKQGEE